MTDYSRFRFATSSQETRKVTAWNKAGISPNIFHDPAFWRVDAYGCLIYWHDYGKRDSELGWEIDHHQSQCLGGSDDLSNLRALHWRNNASLGGLLSGLFKD